MSATSHDVDVDEEGNCEKEQDHRPSKEHLQECGKNYFYTDHDNAPRDKLLEVIRGSDCDEVIAVCLDGSDLANAFTFAAYQNDLELLQAFVDKKIPIDVKNLEGSTALLNACYFNSNEAIRLLLSLDANVHSKDTYGDTALMYSSANGNLSIVEMLLEKDVTLNDQNDCGSTALMSASKQGHKNIVELLLNHGADKELKDAEGKTAMDLAKDNKIVKELLLNYVDNTYVLK